MSNPRKRYAHVGLGGRAKMYLNSITEDHADHAELVALCDRNRGRLEMRRDEVATKSRAPTLYDAADFDRMIAETRPDTVIVTTQDSDHDRYICRAMELGCDTITEKPMTIDNEKCQRIVDTVKQTGRHCRVTFNYRYAPPRSQIKDLLMSGLIGEIHSVDFHWLLNTQHGADYFRRWHRNKKNSGGLLVHKATHHFDLVNWWLSSVPETVYARGERRFYLPATADRMGLTRRGPRCHGCPEARNCPFFLDMAGNANMKALYLDHECHDGYFRDRCVFSDEIDIEDTMHLTVGYRGGALMSYSLHAFMPWEGYVVSFNGSKGRLEHKCQETTYINGDGTVPGELKPEGTTINVFPHFQSPYALDVWTGTGGHGGGDPVMLADLFAPNPPEDKYQRAADHRSGAWSILTGVAGNRSIATGAPVRIDELVQGLETPDYPAMPSGDEPIDPAPYMQAIAAREAKASAS